ncbi:MAG: hypothetical protein WBR29_09685, partial [Gammaproteobacteria bacterium]
VGVVACLVVVGVFLPLLAGLGPLLLLVAGFAALEVGAGVAGVGQRVALRFAAPRAGAEADLYLDRGFAVAGGDAHVAQAAGLAAPPADGV